ncbi:NPCBM/NEW2 domain-containing protein [Luteolibacter luteus]|uniref:Glycosyl hydrolase family 98 putative carbohydrate-binding module domain-containing protein n=1 Tax=Luteolibacter luteus TaxID=2728835 RepID=A0A858RNQ5_9BACT|nr:NPCBM/NEW2 domain-containing protein [Luteolibacter luteus]QJE97573.1 hypothetical protein HHL09_17895 [Luteolibacter luteus]
MKWIFPIFFVAGGMLAPLAAQDSFASVQKSFDAQHQEIDAAYRADLVKLKEQLVVALGKSRENVKKTGDLDAVKILDAELVRWKEEGDLPLVEPELPEIAKLYQVYRTAQVGRLLKKQRAVVAWFQAYDIRLSALEKQLVATDKIEDAEAVRSERDSRRESMELAEAREAVKAADTGEAAVVKQAPRNLKNAWQDLKKRDWKSAEGGKYFKQYFGRWQKVITLDGKELEDRRFLYAHAPSRYEYEFPKPVTGFRAVVLIPKEAPGGASAIFSILSDEGEVFRSKEISASNPKEEIEISFKPSKKLVLVVDENGDDESDWTFWVDPQYQ